MKKPEYTKPFDLEHARAGAPYGCRDGDQATVLKWDGRRPNEPLVGCIGVDDVPVSWGIDGRYVPDERVPRPRDLVMLPLGFIDGKPVFVGDELAWNSETIKAMPGWKPADLINCTWPVPAPVYPESTLDFVDLRELLNKHHAEVSGGVTATSGQMIVTANGRYSLNGVVQLFANAALRHAIDAGQVVLPAAHEKLLTIIGAAYQVAGAHGASVAVLDVLCDPEAATAAQIDAMLPYEAQPWPRHAGRDMAIALAVKNSCSSRCAPIAGHAQLMRAFSDIDLPAIIAGVAK